MIRNVVDLLIIFCISPNFQVNNKIIFIAGLRLHVSVYMWQSICCSEYCVVHLSVMPFFSIPNPKHWQMLLTVVVCSNRFKKNQSDSGTGLPSSAISTVATMRCLMVLFLRKYDRCPTVNNRLNIPLAADASVSLFEHSAMPNSIQYLRHVNNFGQQC